MGLFELNEKIIVACGNGFIFNHINKLTIKIYRNLSNKNKHYFLKLCITMCLRQFFLENFLKIEFLVEHIAMIEEIHFISHVVTGIHIIIHNVDVV